MRAPAGCEFDPLHDPLRQHLGMHQIGSVQTPGHEPLDMSDDVTTILFWDIDGTLLTTGRAGILAWEAAASEAAGHPVDLQQLQTAGLTDFAIGRLILEQLGLRSEPEPLTRLVRRYEASLPDVLPRRQGRVLAGVMDLLQSVREDRPEVGLYLLTGNTRAGARAKLTYYGLFDFFAGGAFADPTGDRSDIARRALSAATTEQPIPLDRVFVIGDTPHDVECGLAIGARTIAVASGDYSVADLETHEPWRALRELPAAEAFLALLEE